MNTQPVVCTSEYDWWPPDLKEAWAALNPAEQRLLLRARWRWRSWPNPGPNPPKIPHSRNELYAAHVGLYAQELAYRAWSECRGADGEVTVTRFAREQGERPAYTPADALSVLGQHPEGLTLTELHDHFPQAARLTLSKWLEHARDYGQARCEPRGRAHAWFAGRREA